MGTTPDIPAPPGTAPGPEEATAASAPLLSLRHVARTVPIGEGKLLTILSDINLDVRPGEHIGIVGRSGTGKSTLLNILGLLDLPTAGEMDFNGEPVQSIPRNRAAKMRGRDIGFVFQQFNLLPGRTAVENVEAPLMYGTGSEFRNRRRIAAEMLERLGLGDRIESKPNRLSGGEQQRVAIARALVRQPKLVLADEPTGALDVETGKTVMGLLDGITRESGAALITITHDLSIANMASRRFALHRGELQAILDGATAQTLSGASATGGAR
ncbi:ABC transporter ATP-binding protein [Brevibacterium sp. 2SA]|uniref:ABC transporter ATP-binding protein n=1 Tax=Brevibacterium sp. 2SA TaxID=2502198 RepID=UPI0010FA3CE5|nr:ABC transporter ATP-binding protein [Brevibacterium sp. 2SA]